MKCAKCIAYWSADDADDAVTIAKGEAICLQHSIVTQDTNGLRWIEPYANPIEKKWKST